MEVHQVHLHPVGLGFRLSQAVVHRPGLLQHRGGEVQVADEVLHIVEGGVVVVMMMLMAVLMFVVMMVFVVMVMVQALLPLSVDHHVHVGAGDAAGLGGDGVELHPRQTHVVEGVQEFLPVGEQLIQSGGEHVPGGSHVTL